MHLSVTRRHYKDKVYETTLLRRSYREDGKVKNETLANLSHLPAETIGLIRESLAGKSHVLAGAEWRIERSLPHGHVAAVAAQAKTLGMAELLGPPCRERDIALALIVARVCRPASTGHDPLVAVHDPRGGFRCRGRVNGRRVRGDGLAGSTPTGDRDTIGPPSCP